MPKTALEPSSRKRLSSLSPVSIFHDFFQMHYFSTWEVWTKRLRTWLLIGFLEFFDQNMHTYIS